MCIELQVIQLLQFGKMYKAYNLTYLTLHYTSVVYLNTIKFWKWVKGGGLTNICSCPLSSSNSFGEQQIPRFFAVELLSLLFKPGRKLSKPETLEPIRVDYRARFFYTIHRFAKPGQSAPWVIYMPATTNYNVTVSKLWITQHARGDFHVFKFYSFRGEWVAHGVRVHSQARPSTSQA